MSEGSAEISGVVHLEFQDFESFSSAARGWNLDFLQMDRGSFRGTLSHLMTPKIVLSKVVLGRKVLQQGEIPVGFRTFAYAAGSELDLRWRGQELGAEQLMVFPRGQGLESVSKPGFDVFVLSISDWLLDRVAEGGGLTSIDELFPDGELVRISREQFKKLRGLSEVLLSSGIVRPDLISDWGYRDALEGELVDALMSAMRSGIIEGNQMRMTASRRKALKAAVEVMKGAGRRPLSIGEIERYCGVSQRTLRYAFQESFGISPKQYLKKLRLSRVRTELESGRHASVAQAAGHWGFWHMGQFAKDYRKHFGKLPSGGFRPIVNG